MAGSRSEGFAEHLLTRFGGLAPALAASPEALQATLGDMAAARFLGLVEALLTARLRRGIEAGPLLDRSDALADYLHFRMAHLRAEELRVLFLDGGNRLLADEVISRGSSDETPVFPREIMRRALELGAAALLLAHNHPSGNHEPSDPDLVATRNVVEAARTLGIRVHDHLIVSGTGATSLRGRGLM